MSVGDRVSVRFEADATPFNATLKTTTSSMQGFVTTLGQVKATAAGGLVGGKDPLGGLGAAMSSAETKVTSFGGKLKNLGSVIAGQATSFGVATASIWGAYNAYDNLVKVEIRAESASNRVKTTQATLTQLQLKHTEALQKGNLSSEEMALLEERITNTKAKLATAQAREADLQGDVNEAWAGFASQIGPQVVAAGASIVQLVTNLNGVLPKSGGFINTLKSAFTNLIPSLRTAKAESLLLTPALGGVATSGTSVKNAVAGLVSGVSPLSMGFKGVSAETKAMNTAMSATKGEMILAGSGMAGLGGQATGLTPKIKALGLALKGLALGPVGIVGGTVFGSLLAAGGLQQLMGKDFQEMARKNSAAQLAWLKNIGLSDDAIRGLLPTLEKFNSVFGLTTPTIEDVNAALHPLQKSVAQTHDSIVPLATSQSALINRLIVLRTQLQDNKIGITEYSAEVAKLKIPGDQFLSIMDQVDASFKRGKASTSAWKSQAIGLSTSFVDLNHNWHATGMEIAAYEANLMKAAGAQSAFTGETVKHNNEMNLTVKHATNFVDKLLEEHTALENDALEMGAGAGELAKYAASSKNTSDEIKAANDALKMHVIAMAIDTKWVSDATKQNEIYINGVYKGIKAADDWAKAMMTDVQAEISQRTQLVNISNAMDRHANLLVFSTGKMQDIIKTEREVTKGHIEEQIAIAKQTDWVKNATLVEDERTKGVLEGTRAANDWIISAIHSTAAAKAQEAQLRRDVETMTGFKDLNDLTNTELQTMAQRFLETKSAADAFGVVMASRLSPALETFSGLINADSMKSFNEEWKKMNFGSIPKGSRGEFKDMFKELMGLADKSTGIVTAIDAVFTAIYTGSKKVKNSDIRKVFKEINDDLDDLGKVNKNAVGLGDLFKPLETLKGKKLEDFIFKFGDSLNELKKALADKWIDPQEKLNILVKYSDAANISGDAIQKLGEKIGLSQDEIDRWKVADAASDTDKLGTAAGDASPKVGTLADNILATGGTAVDARAKVDMVTGAFDVLQNKADTTNPKVNINIVPATGLITRLIGNFDGYLKEVVTKDPHAKLNIIDAVKNITRLINDFKGWIKTVEQANPKVKVNIEGALNQIDSIVKRMQDVDKMTATATITVKHVDTFETKKLRYGGSFIHPGFQHGGAFIANTHQNFKGAEIAEFNKPELVTVTPLTDPNNISDRTIKVTTQHVDQFRKPSRTGPINVYIDSPIYLYPNGEMVGRMQKKYVLDDLGKYPNVQ